MICAIACSMSLGRGLVVTSLTTRNSPSGSSPGQMRTNRYNAAFQVLKPRVALVRQLRVDRRKGRFKIDGCGELGGGFNDDVRQEEILSSKHPPIPPAVAGVL